MSAQGQMGGSLIMKMLCPLHLFFSWGLSGAAQRQTGGSFIRKNVISTASIFLWLPWGLSGVHGGSPGAYRGQFYWEKVISTAFILFRILGGLIDVWIRNNNWNICLTLSHFCENLTKYVRISPKYPISTTFHFYLKVNHF